MDKIEKSQFVWDWSVFIKHGRAAYKLNSLYASDIWNKQPGYRSSALTLKAFKWMFAITFINILGYLFLKLHSFLFSCLSHLCIFLPFMA